MASRSSQETATLTSSLSFRSFWVSYIQLTTLACTFQYCLGLLFFTLLALVHVQPCAVSRNCKVRFVSCMFLAQHELANLSIVVDIQGL